MFRTGGIQRLPLPVLTLLTKCGPYLDFTLCNSSEEASSETVYSQNMRINKRLYYQCSCAGTRTRRAEGGEQEAQAHHGEAQDAHSQNPGTGYHDSVWRVMSDFKYMTFNKKLYCLNLETHLCIHKPRYSNNQ